MVAFSSPLGTISASRTLVKSAPELREMVSGMVELAGPDVSVDLAEKGFGTRVVITAAAGSGLGPAELEALLDALAEPRRRPYSK